MDKKVAIEKLIEMGDYLQGIDTVRERNESGFNQYDWVRWNTARGNGEKMAHILRKYRKSQLIPTFGDVTEIFALFPDTPMIRFDVQQLYGSVAILNNFLPKDKFEEFRNICKTAGCWWDSANRNWFIPGKNVQEFDFDALSKQLIEIGFEVISFKKPNLAKQEILTPDAALWAIQNRQAAKTVVVKRLTNGAFAFAFPYSPILNDLFKNTTGKLSGITEYIDPERAAREGKIPHSRETFQIELVQEAIEKIRTLLPDWKILQEGVEEAIAERGLYVSELQKPIPEVAAKLAEGCALFAFQNEGVRFFQRGSGLLGDEMGTGKTIQSLAFVAGWNHRVLVVCPKVVRRTWINEAKKFFPSYFNEFNSVELISKNIKKHGLPNLLHANIASVNYESLAKFKDAIIGAGFDTLIIDESHRMMNRHTITCESIYDIAPSFKHIFGLSGTAIKNKKAELFTQLDLIRPGLFESKEELKMATIGGTWNKIQECYLARQKSQVLKWLPAKMTQIIEMDTDEKIPDYDPAQPLMIDEISRLKADVAKGKAKLTAHFVQELLDSSDDCVLVFSDSVEAATEIYNELGEDQALLHHGQLSDNVREDLKSKFQNPDTKQRVFVSTRQSLAVGATLTRANLVVFSDLPWTAADVRQAEDRTHRVGQSKPVNVYWITIANNNWDRKVTGIVKKKYELNKKVNAGQQLTAEEREWMDKAVSIEDLRKELMK